MAYDGMTYTQFLGMKKPGYDSNIDVKDFNYNFDKLDNFASETNRKLTSVPIYKDYADLNNPDFIEHVPTDQNLLLYVEQKDTGGSSYYLVQRKIKLKIKERYLKDYGIYRADFYAETWYNPDGTEDTSAEYYRLDANVGGASSQPNNFLRKISGHEADVRPYVNNTYVDHGVDETEEQYYKEDSEQIFSYASLKAKSIMLYTWKMDEGGITYTDGTNRQLSSPSNVTCSPGLLDFVDLSYAAGGGVPYEIVSSWQGPIASDDRHMHGSLIIETI